MHTQGEGGDTRSAYEVCEATQSGLGVGVWVERVKSFKSWILKICASVIRKIPFPLPTPAPDCEPI